jgi:hypothetical protein
MFHKLLILLAILTVTVGNYLEIDDSVVEHTYIAAKHAYVERELDTTGCNPGEYMSGGVCMYSDAGYYPSKGTGLVPGTMFNGATSSGVGFCASPDFSKVLTTRIGGGIQQSKDGGLTWTNYSPPGGVGPASNLNWAACWTSPTFDIIILTVTNQDYLYSSYDGGVTYAPMYGGGSKAWKAVSATNDGVRIAATHNTPTGTITISIDSGATWNAVTNVATCSLFSGITVSQDFAIISATCSGSPLRRTTDGGNTWSTMGQSISNSKSIDCTADMLTCYVATDGSGLYKTTDGGSTWTNIKNPNGSDSTSNSFQGIAVSPDGIKIGTVQQRPSSRVMASGDSGSTFCPGCFPDAISVDGGGTRQRPCPSGTYSVDGSVQCTVCPVGKYSGPSASACLSCTPGTTTAGSGAAGVSQSVCEVCAPGFYSVTGYSSAAGGCSAVSPGYYPSKQVITTSLSGAGRGWTGLAVSEDFTKIAACLRGDYIYLSIDTGSSWTPLVGAGKGRDWLGVTASPTFDKLAATCTNCYIMLSLDGGMTWKTLSGSGTRYWIGIAATPDFVSIVASVHGTSKNIWRTDNSGVTWTALSGVCCHYWHLLTASQDLVHIAATEPRESLVYISHDSGQTFFSVAACPTGGWDIVGSYDFATLVVACGGSTQALYKSIDSGVTWNAMTGTETIGGWTGITGNYDLSRMVASSYSNYLYQSDDAGESWAGLYGDVVGGVASTGYATDESKCPSGSYSIAAQPYCTLCPQQSFSAAGATVCTSCNPGYTTPGIGVIGIDQSACDVCAPGYISSTGLATGTGTGCAPVTAGNYPTRTVIMTSPPSSNWGCVIASDDFSLILLGARSGYLWLSENSGVAWVPLYSAGVKDWLGVAGNGDFTKLIAAGSNWLWTSYDKGKTWIQLTSAGNKNWIGIAVTADFTSMVASVYGANSNIFRSDDSGATFAALTGAGQHYWHQVAATQDLVNIIAMATNENLIFISRDSGVTWTNTYLDACWGGTMSYDFQKIMIACNTNMYYSNDAGLTWSPLDNLPSTEQWKGVSGNYDLTKIITTSGNGSPSTGTTYQTSDGGTTWVTTTGAITGAEAEDGYGTAVGQCPAGTYSTGAAAKCEVCSQGTYSIAGASVCTGCPLGYTTAGIAVIGSSDEVCTECAPGYYSTTGLSVYNNGALQGCSSVNAGSYPTKTIKISNFASGTKLTGVATSADFSKQIVSICNDYLQISLDSGISWVPVKTAGDGTECWTSVQVSPMFDKIIATAGNDGMYMSEDYGKTWKLVYNSALTATSVYYGVVATPDLSSMVIINSVYLYRSNNYGSTWTALQGQIPSPKAITSSQDLTKIMVNSAGNSIYLSINGGATFTKTNAAPGVSTAWGLVSSADMSKVISVYKGSSFPMLYLSVNMGSSWTPISASISGLWRGLSGNADLSKVIAVTMEGGSIQTDNSGATWTTAGNIKGALAIDGRASSTAFCPPGTYSPTSPSTNCVGCPLGTYSSAGSTVCTKCPLGQTTHGIGTIGTSTAVCSECSPGWYGTINSSTDTCTKVPAGYYPSTPITTTPLKLDGTMFSNAWISNDLSMVLASAYNGWLHVSYNSGVSWRPITAAGQRKWRAIYANQGMNYIIAAGDNMYPCISWNGGSTWEDLLGAGVENWYGIATNNDFTTMIGVTNGKGRMLRSTDSGATWAAIASAGIRDFVSIAASTDLTKIAAVDQGSSVVAISDDGGRSFGVEQPTTVTMYGVAMSSDGTKIIVNAGYNVNQLKFYVSTNFGFTWATLGATLTSNTFLNFHGNLDLSSMVIADAYNSIFFTSDGGLNWSKTAKLSTGLIKDSGATTKSLCPKGYYSSVGSTGCIACPKGTYSEQTASTTCSSCPTGYTNNGPGITLASMCSVCAPGFAGQSSSNSICTPVPAGSYPSNTIAISSHVDMWWGASASADFSSMIIGGWTYLYRSDDSGASWTPMKSAGQKHWFGLYSSPDMTNLMATAREQDYIYKSSNGGVTWEALLSGGKRTWMDVKATSDLKNIVAITWGWYTTPAETSFLYISTDYGETFNVANNAGDRDWVGLAANQDLSKILAAVHLGYIYRSTDGGITWAALLSAKQQNWRGVAASSDFMTIVAVNLDAATLAQRILISKDGGNTWNGRTKSVPGNHNYMDVWCNYDCSKILIPVWNDLVLQSDDGGITFTSTSTETNALASAGGAAKTTLCPAGTYSTEGMIECSVCSTGSYSGVGATVCTQCNTGYTTNGVGFVGTDASACMTCALGYKGSTIDGETGCVPQYTPTTMPTMLPTTMAPSQAPTYGQDDCKPGMYYTPGQSNTVIPNCSYCPNGKYTSIQSSTSCTDCAAGTYNGVIGLTVSCTECSVGKYSSTGATSCTKCDAGSYSGVGSTSCTPCSPGYYGLADQVCSICPSGTSSSSGSSACAVCAAGSFSGPGAASCTPCTAGTYAPNGQPCMTCPVNTFSSAGASSCTSCIAGTTSNGASSICLPCEAGFYALPGQQCELCPAGKFSDAGASNCSDCSNGEYSTNGSSKCSACSATTA